jgi:inosine-uridine nucleoside N-ribohydrolase
MNLGTSVLAAALAALVLLVLPAGSATAADPAPVGLIFDTDLGADVDDALALAMLHAFHERGECRLLAVTLTNEHVLSGPLADAINTFYGHANVPLGAVRQGVKAASPYIGTAELKDGDRLRYPRSVQATADLPDALTVLRRTLAAQPDGSVVIAQVGQSTNLARLLKTSADDASPLSGTELVKKKVRFLSIMAGTFAPVRGNAHNLEYNVTSDIPSAQALAAGWPTPIVWSGFEIGLRPTFPAAVAEHHFGYVPHHPVADAYRLHNKMPYSQPTWDLTSVLYAVRPEGGYFDLSGPGRVVVESDGFTRFTPEADGRDRYLVLKTDAQVERVREALALLASEPPHRPAGSIELPRTPK